MSINQILQPIDNFFISINNNKSTLILIILLLAIYAVFFNKIVTEKFIDIYLNNLFKIILFGIIMYISSVSTAIGISLAIILLLSLQIVTNYKINESIQHEKFSQIAPSDQAYLSDEYLTNPLELQKNLSPPVNLDLKLTTPDELYIQMLKKGKNLLDDSYNLDKDVEKRFDIREKQIAEITKRNGIELIDSGLNRLQKSDQGEYNNNDISIKPSKFIKYNKFLDSNKNNSLIMASYMELLNNYNLLTNKQLENDSFNNQLDKVYLNELELLETIYKVKKQNISEQVQKLIENEIDNIKRLKNENKKWYNNLKQLFNLIE